MIQSTSVFTLIPESLVLYGVAHVFLFNHTISTYYHLEWGGVALVVSGLCCLLHWGGPGTSAVATSGGPQQFLSLMWYAWLSKWICWNNRIQRDSERFKDVTAPTQASTLGFTLPLSVGKNHFICPFHIFSCVVQCRLARSDSSSGSWIYCPRSVAPCETALNSWQRRQRSRKNCCGWLQICWTKGTLARGPAVFEVHLLVVHFQVPGA